eukprot:Phypoly_transcript_03074.p1 GENE.Phypoly_transcript_03074~~Phypoly_transcript_03074.p1  ORF type:complete len:772 (+),score=146.02 Phypoly_transcript_03074:298-2316(+)
MGIHHPKRRKSVDVGLVSASGAKKDALNKQDDQENDQQKQSQLPSTPKMNAGTEVDVLGDDILFEANNQHRREFEDFLRSVKDIKDVHNWLKNFSNEAPKKVAIVKISRRILENDYGTAQAASALSFMFKFGLFPIVVHGGWNELSRDTISEVVARRKSFSHRLKAEIRKCGVGAAILTPDVCSVEPAINPSTNPFKEKRMTKSTSLGLITAVGEGRRASLHMEGGLGFQVNNIDSDRLIAYLEKGKIPIWDGVATTVHGAEIPLNGDVTTVELAHLLHPFRIIFACNDGGVLDKDNKAIPVVYMDKDYDELMSASWVSQRRKIQLLQLKRIVSVVPSSCTVVVTAIDAVTHQLMYPRLANETIIKRAEENHVHVIDNVNMIDKEKLKQLIEDSFGRPLADGYLDNLNDNLYRIYLITGMDGEYNGCAVIMRGVEWDANGELHVREPNSDSESPHHLSPHYRPTQSHDPQDADSDPHVIQRILENRRRNGLQRSESPTSRERDRSESPTNPNHQHSESPTQLSEGSTHRSESPNPANPSDNLSKSGDSLENRQDSFQIPSIELCDGDSTNSSAMEELNKFYYLCKFCVRKAAQGAGLGDLLWRSLQRDIDKLYWRSRTNNPLNAWYYARCQGSFRTNAHFTVFWYGDDRFADGAALIEDALARSLTILPVPM